MYVFKEGICEVNMWRKENINKCLRVNFLDIKN